MGVIIDTEVFPPFFRTSPPQKKELKTLLERLSGEAPLGLSLDRECESTVTQLRLVMKHYILLLMC